MRICHIITRLIVGGAQENTLLTCEGLHRRGHEVLLLSGPETGPEGSLQDRAAQGGYAFELVESLGREIRPLRDWRCRRELARRLRAWCPDVVHTHSSKAGVLGRLAARDAGVPTIIHTIHGMSFNRTQPALKRKLFASLERRCARFTDRIVTVADAMVEQCLAANVGRPEQFQTVYSGMDVEAFDPNRYDREAVRRAWGFREDAVIVGTVARLFANKGYEQLIPAMAEAARRDERLRFVWIGGGAWTERLRAELDLALLSEHVVLPGLVPPSKIPELLSGVDMLVHPSQWEGLPRAVVQALLMERPAISFDIDGAPEVVIPGETGILVPLNDVSGLADAMVELARDPERRARYGQAGRARCLRQFDARQMGEALERIYSQLFSQ